MFQKGFSKRPFKMLVPKVEKILEGRADLFLSWAQIIDFQANTIRKSWVRIPTPEEFFFVLFLFIFKFSIQNFLSFLSGYSNPGFLTNFPALDLNFYMIRTNLLFLLKSFQP